MNAAYHKELIQVIAVGFAMLQVDLYGDDDMQVGDGAAFDEITVKVRDERQRQINKWGVRTREKIAPDRFLAVLMEEVGEVAEEIAKLGPISPLVQAVIDVGQQARAELEGQ